MEGKVPPLVLQDIPYFHRQKCVQQPMSPTVRSGGPIVRLGGDEIVSHPNESTGPYLPIPVALLFLREPDQSRH